MSKQEITQKQAQEMIDALLNLVFCPAFTGALFEKDKESHKAWTLARAKIAEIQKKSLTPPAHSDTLSDMENVISTKLVECGSCSCYHRPNYWGDCRNDLERFPHYESLEILYKRSPKLLREAREIVLRLKREHPDFGIAMLEKAIYESEEWS